MTPQPRQEPFEQARISTEQVLTSSPFASPLTKTRVCHLGKACKKNRGDCSNAYVNSSSRTNSSKYCWSHRMNHPAKELLP
jgi:hypothetical protein